MKFEDFREKLSVEIAEKLEREGIKVFYEYKTIHKTNMPFEATIFRNDNSSSGVCLNVSTCYSEYLRSGSYDRILEKSIEMVRETLPDEDIVDMESFTKYKNVKDRIYMSIINTGRNAELLSNVPHYEIEDLSVVFRIIISDNDEMLASTLITYSLMKEYGVTLDELRETALENITPETFQVKGMLNVLSEMMDGECPFIGVEESMEEQMYVAMAIPTKRYWGASMLADKVFLDETYRKFGKGFYILPSSVRELIFIPEDKTPPGNSRAESANFLKSIVEAVNTEAVPVEDLLSDSVYFYDGKLARIV